jgi:hypothetical protein
MRYTIRYCSVFFDELIQILKENKINYRICEEGTYKLVIFMIIKCACTLELI